MLAAPIGSHNSQSSPLYFTRIDYSDRPTSTPKAYTTPDQTTEKKEPPNESKVKHTQISSSQPLLMPAEPRPPMTYPVTWDEVGIKGSFERAQELDLPSDKELYS